ncbi:hypothetical protein RchiOBHm_Chr4g0398341 [Rosa chinensis]|uniref:Uncharacterized protein n=1 Tax=Rosa chinensis TaxID=74649 RepID=A0A2P6QS87_ROSCH|nr:hypothetical protein RchiOBHm_Chr4g0398341 [Rosa chinensis]
MLQKAKIIRGGSLRLLTPKDDRQERKLCSGIARGYYTCKRPRRSNEAD